MTDPIPVPVGLAEARRGPRPLTWGVLAGGVIFAAACLSGATLYVRAAAALHDEVRLNLMHTAASGAAMVNGELHRTFTDPVQEGTPAYEAAVEPLRRIQGSNPEITFIYTYVLTPDGKLRFVLDAAAPGDADGDGVDDKAHIMEVYPDTNPAMREPFRSGRQSADEAIESDKWGAYLSGYAPVHDRDGRVVGAVGVDLRAHTYLGHLVQMRRAAAAGLVIALVLSVAVGWLIVLASRVTTRANDQRELALAELKRSNLDLAEAKSRAEDAARTKAAFLAMMSHEIRTPMNGVLGMLGLVLDSDLAGKQREWAAIAFKSAKTLLVILNDVLDSSKIEAGKLELEFVDFEVRAMLEEATDLLAERAQSKGLELVCLVHPSVPDFLRGDPGRLRQIILNLAGNAIKFTDKGEVVIRAALDSSAADEATVRFEVSDTGTGIPLEAQKQLFQPFAQVDASISRRYGGTGLGLSICRQLVDLMGGTIGLQSTVGGGSTFSFTARLQHASAQDMPARRDLTGLRALIIDDSAASRAMFVDAIAKFGMQSAQAEHGEEAMLLLREAAARGEPFDVALVDIVLPGMDGFELARLINADAALQATRLVLVTAQGQKGHARQTQQVGASAYLTKPVHESALYDCIAAVTARSGTNPGTNGSPAPLITRHVLSAAQARRRGRVLVVEDQEVNQMLAVELLERWGFRADVVDNGLEALAAMGRTEYGLVLMDCQMPGMDGFEATQAIRRAEPAGRRVPIIAMTANAMVGDRERCLEAGMDDYISKPIDPVKVFDTIKRWLPTSPADEPPSTPPVAVAPPYLDEGQLRSLVGNDPVKVRKYLRLFVTTAEPTLHALDAAVRARDEAGLRRHAHKLRGSSANIGAAKLALVAAELEQLAAEDWGRAEDLRTHLWQTYTQTRAYADAI